MITAYYILFSLLGMYAMVLSYLAIGFLKSKRFYSEGEKENTPLTIIVCARNEEKNIAKCIKTISQQTYDAQKIQLIVINDASTDNTVNVASAMLKNSEINYKIISNAEQKGKKKSITYAMGFAQHELIISRDADTYTSSFNWLQSISEYFVQTKADMIIGPVAISDNSGSLWALQAIENNILNLMSCGSANLKMPFLCSGANLIFTRSLFERTKGYESHAQIASGDDVLFLEDAKKLGDVKIEYLKSREAIVYTYPSFSFKKLLIQRIRWSSKFTVNKNKFNLFLAVLTTLVNASMLFWLLIGFLVPQIGLLGLIFVGIKLIIDFLLLFLASGFLKNPALGLYVLPIGLIYPIYSCMIAFGAVFLKPKWK
jgi:biofilm PGA synthesis N-glycosyltransferase PgaC